MRWPRVRWRRVAGLLAALLVTVSLLYTLIPGLFSVGLAQGEGVVLNTETQEPIADAVVILECRRRLLHGSSLVKYVATETDWAGRYAFGFFDVARCDLGYVHPAKAGYVEVVFGQHSYEQVPDRLYLTPIADARLRQLRRDHRMADRQFSAPRDEYSALYRGFYEAKRKAVTREEQDFVVEAYCRRLIELYGRLTPEEREETRRYGISSVGGRVAHEEEVEKWCRACR